MANKQCACHDLGLEGGVCTCRTSLTVKEIIVVEMALRHYTNDLLKRNAQYRRSTDADNARLMSIVANNRLVIPKLDVMFREARGY